jgi:hypothetical protein
MKVKNLASDCVRIALEHDLIKPTVAGYIGKDGNESD